MTTWWNSTKLWIFNHILMNKNQRDIYKWTTTPVEIHLIILKIKGISDNQIDLNHKKEDI